MTRTRSRHEFCMKSSRYSLTFSQNIQQNLSPLCNLLLTHNVKEQKNIYEISKKMKSLKSKNK